MRRQVRVTIGVVAAAIAACATPTPEIPRNDAPAPPAAVPTPAVGTAAPFDTAAVSIAGTAQGMSVLDGVRIDADRVLTFTFRGDSTPRMEAGYATAPVTQCGSGAEVPVTGKALLRIRFRGTDAHVFDGERAIVTVPERNRVLPGPQITHLVMTCDFEGEVEWVIGLAHTAGFRVVRGNDSTVTVEFTP